jgi:hypothetical protein
MSEVERIEASKIMDCVVCLERVLSKRDPRFGLLGMVSFPFDRRFDL